LDPYYSNLRQWLTRVFFFFRNPLYHSDFIYNLTPSGQKFNKNSEIVAQKADEIIKKRRLALIDQVNMFRKFK